MNWFDIIVGVGAVATVLAVVQQLYEARSRHRQRRKEESEKTEKELSEAQTHPNSRWGINEERLEHELRKVRMNSESDFQSERIAEILSSCSGSNIEDLLATWNRYLRRSLVFPFEVRRRESGTDDGNILSSGTYTARRLIGVRDGDIVTQLMDANEVSEVALSSIEAVEFGSKNFECLEDYSRWRKPFES